MFFIYHFITCFFSVIDWQVSVKLIIYGIYGEIISALAWHCLNPHLSYPVGCFALFLTHSFSHTHTHTGCSTIHPNWSSSVSRLKQTLWSSVRSVFPINVLCWTTMRVMKERTSGWNARDSDFMSVVENDWLCSSFWHGVICAMMIFFF